ncbi:NAD-dependent epimerase/dehydratase family protein [Vibrio tasmaniensis]|uniref:NAD-dependent epimerase/dehydratase family protein n=1 Tax=Vibrio tasmaniensis TaxID=212663 RepID=UPI00108095C0|nr:NAD-dependent epimerase/dehydratase family protein [Vibrio tasmaniensis]
MSLVMCNGENKVITKVLIAGASGYIGRHVTSLFTKSGFEVFTYGRDKVVTPPIVGLIEDRADFEGFFDVVVNCARPHWSQFSAHEIADVEQKLLSELDLLAAKGATKIHTSGVWLFGNASSADLRQFRLKPLDAVRLDVETIHSAIRSRWHVVYCPSLVYGGEDCQLKRIVESFASQTIQVGVPSIGYNQYVHVYDIAKFYLLLAQGRTLEKQHFIAETQGYSPAEFARLLLAAKAVTKVRKIRWEEFEVENGSLAVEVEKMNLTLPISYSFEATESISEYIGNYI